MSSESKTFSKQSSARPEQNEAYKGLSAPAVELPKGGGAIKSIDDKFSVNPANGTSSFNYPLPFSSQRGMVPGVALSYNSGVGNGAFGMGWSLSQPSIRRKTEKELPQYHDAIDSDTYIFSQAEDLVPVIEQSGTGWKYTEKDNAAKTHTIRYYRPRIEGLFARIERWTEKSSGLIHWRVITKDNVTTIFGMSTTAKIADAKDALRIFEWLPEFSYNDKGYCMVYEYKVEDGKNIDATQVYERNRVNGLAPFVNTYIKRIRYGNVQMFANAADAIPSEFLFEAVFDYGDHDTASPPFKENGNWPYRTDAFSEYKAGFEIRTCRRCERVLFYHNINELPGASALVRSLSFAYSNNGIDGFTFLTGITETGYIKNIDSGYTQKTTPPFTFEYQKHAWDFTVRQIDATSLVNAPAGIDNQQYQWLDLYSEGLPGILSEQGTGLFYKSNLGEGNFSTASLVSPKPSFTGWGQGLQWQELEGDGIKQLVQLAAEPKGYFEYDDDGGWQNFVPLGNVPNIDFKNPNVKQLDLNGDGVADILISEDEVFTWYASAGKNGYNTALHNVRAYDEEQGPAIVFADETQSIFLADINGDGLTDIVRIRNGEICYWPSLGFGRFGAKVTMGHAPLFDTAEAFNPAFIMLADIDGSGTPDVVYLGKNTCSAWMNLQGNRFADAPVVITPFPAINNYNKVSMFDLLGNGVSCIVWNSTLPQNAGAPLKYIDLMGSKKPHVMVGYKNNRGKEINLVYTPSTWYYLQDKMGGTPWITKLPFPVQCVSGVTTYDRIRQTRLVSTYTYHHGYYDAAEREFRGFGRVEQMDAECITNFVMNSTGMANNITESDLMQQPVLIKSWFHTGAFINRTKILTQFAKEYFTNTVFDEHVMPEPQLEGLAGIDDWREALRACKGLLLRKEVYALDKNGNTGNPYTAEQHTAQILQLRDKGINKHGVFLMHETESITYHYEQNPADPRILHSFNIEIDKYGNLLRSASVAYGRVGTDSSLLPAERDVQSKQFITCQWNSFTNDITTQDDDYRAPVLWQSQSFQITGKTASGTPYYTFADIDEATSPASGTNIGYTQKPSTGIERRIIEWSRVRYRDDDGITMLNYGQLSSKALVHEKYKAAFTDDMLDATFAGKTTAALLSPVLTSVAAGGGGYIKEDGYYWIPSGQQNYNTTVFYLSTEYKDAFGKKTVIEYDAYHLFVAKATDAVQNSSQVKQFSYRVLQPLLMQDANGNANAVRYDELGIVTATFAIGKSTDNGDIFDTSSNEASAMDQPGAEFSYSLFEWYNQSTAPGFDPSVFYKPMPNYVYAKTWEVHYKTLPTRNTQYQQSYAYLDGAGKTVLTKAQAEPGLAMQLNSDGTTVIIDTTPNIRWLGDGRVILNNKGNPVKQYEPYFSIDNSFDDEKDMVELGVTQVLYYDALGRQIKIVHPNGAFASVAFTAWDQTSYDENDNVSASGWNDTMLAYLQTLPDTTAEQQKRKQYRIAQQKQANTNAAAHANTPSHTYLDALGRAFLSVADNVTEKLKTTTVFDIEGNERVINDPMGRDAMACDYDMLGDRVFENSIDAGRRWHINNVKGHPLAAWDDRGFAFSFTYDDLSRPADAFVNDGITNNNYEHFVYGEDTTGDTANNLRGKIYMHYSQAGVITNTSYDFKGNVTAAANAYCQDYKQTIDWTTIPAVMLESEVFVKSAQYDALNRPVSVITPHTATIPQNEIIPGYNAGGLLNNISVKLRGSATATDFVTSINYSAKRQRDTIYYKNGTRTQYSYDPFTFRLTGLKTTTAMPAATQQDIVYTYDPVGNITAIRDDAQPEIIYSGENVQPENAYVYDAVYRLTAATGRKQIGQNVIGYTGTGGGYRNHPFIPNTGTPGPDDGNAFCNYIETFAYDAVGNMQSQTHRASSFAWTRSYKYGLTAGDNKNNQLRESTVGADTFTYDSYDEHGNMKKLEHLASVEWNFKDHFIHAGLGGGGNAYYVYEASGNRVRKVIEDTAGRKMKERFYLGGFEIYREYALAGTVDLERESLQVMDDKRVVALVETQTIDKGLPVATPLILQRYQYDNHLGSASLELDETAALISYEEYYPFGTTSYQAGTGTKQVPLKRYRYTGKERDEESGLNYHGARYYIPWLCRWMSTDPLGIGDGLNIYAYTHNNPIILTDPNGHQSVSTDEQTPPQNDANIQKEKESYHDFIMSLGDSPPGQRVSYTDEQNAINSMAGGIIAPNFKARIHDKKHDTPEFHDFKYRLYMAHYFHALLDMHKKDLENNVPFEEIFSAKGLRPDQKTLEVAHGEIMLEEAALAFKDMRKAAAKAGVDIGVTSAYRNPHEDFKIWDTNFEENYSLTVKGTTVNKTPHKINDLDYSRNAIEHVLAVRSANKAMPGFSNHTKGIAFDLGVGKKLAHIAWDPVVEKTWTDTKQYQWLKEHGKEFGFERIKSEAWHWEYHGKLNTNATTKPQSIMDATF